MSTTVRLIKREQCYGVRVSTFFYFDDNAGRRSINQRLTPEQALEQAKLLARGERARVCPRMIKRAPIELPPKVARAFVKDRRAFFAERDVIKQDEIAARQLHALREHYTGKLRLMDIKMMFSMMMDDLEKEAD